MDLNKRAFEIVRALTGQIVENSRSVSARNGGKRGGPARAKVLSPERRKEIAEKASRSRWSKNHHATDVLNGSSNE